MKEKTDFHMSTIQFMLYIQSKHRTPAQITHRLRYYKRLNGTPCDSTVKR